MSQGTGQTSIKAIALFIARQAEVKRRVVDLPLTQRLHVQHFSVLSTTIDLINLSTIQQVYLRIL